MAHTDYDVIVAGGGPSGSTAAERLAASGARVLLIDREHRIKPCGGAIPSVAMARFNLPPHLIKSRVGGARMTSPTGNAVAMKIGARGHVAMVDRDSFDPYLRERARERGCDYQSGRFTKLERQNDGSMTVTFQASADGTAITASTRVLIGADGANSAVRKAIFGPDKRPPYVFAYHEIVRSPQASPTFDPASCEVVYDGAVSPDFYGWVFPHGAQTSVGCGTAVKGFDVKGATRELRARFGLGDAETIRCEGAPLPLKPMRRWDDGRNTVLTGDAAGTVAPSSGEGIYYAMHCGELAAEGAMRMLSTGDARHLAQIRKRFMKAHGRVFLALGVLQYIWYRNDRRREQFVKMCADPDIQRLTWESYLTKSLTRHEPLAHLRVAWKDLQQLLNVAWLR